MEWVLGIGFMMMTILCLRALNKLDDTRLEVKLLQQENDWLRGNRPETPEQNKE